MSQDRLRADVEMLGRALAGGLDSVPAMLFESGVSTSAVDQMGRFLFRIRKLPGYHQHSYFYLRMDCLQRLLAAGIDLRSVVVDPFSAFKVAVLQFKFLDIRRYLKEILHDLQFVKKRRPRPLQTLLEMAIRCGQLDATKLLIQAHCEASSLTASDLEEPFYLELWESDSYIDPDGIEQHNLYEVAVNKNVQSAEAARLAYHLCRHRHQVVLVQWTGWWSRHSSRVRVAWRSVVDHIASFALAVPPLPEILQLPRPVGTRNAARRAARRRAKADCPHPVNKEVPTATTAVTGSIEHVVTEVIEEAGVQPIRVFAL